MTEHASDVLIAVPPTTPTQHVRLLERMASPTRSWVRHSATVELYRVRPGEGVVLTYHVRLGNALHTAALDPNEDYLRVSPLLDRSAEVCDFAELHRRTDARSTMFALYESICRHSTYEWPPSERGASRFITSRSGDCGEMAIALVAAARALGIPARPVFGAFAIEQLAGHAWAEYFAPSTGWVTVDPAMGNAALASGTADAVDRWFDFVPDDRIVFSFDCDHSLPGLADPCGMTNVPVVLAGYALQWGGALLNGGVPYLQPGYPLISEHLGSPTSIPMWRIAPSPPDQV